MWGSGSGGFAMISDGADVDFAPWAELVAGRVDVGCDRVVWARLKTELRATEKVYRSYRCEVSRLLDVSRQVVPLPHTAHARVHSRARMRSTHASTHTYARAHTHTHTHTHTTVTYTSAVNLLRLSCGHSAVSRCHHCGPGGSAATARQQALPRLRRRRRRLPQRLTQPSPQHAGGAQAGPGVARVRASAHPYRLCTNQGMIAVGVGVGVLVLSLILVLLLRMRASRGHISTSPRPSLGPSDRKFKSWLSTISKLSSAFSRLSQGILLLHFFPLCLALILSGISNLKNFRFATILPGIIFFFP